MCFDRVLCFAIAGWQGVLWGTIVRTISLWHTTWSINSICHLWGTRPNKTRDESGNVWWLGLLTLGEGWHNNHHARPASALHGWRWYEVDISGYVIRLMARLGLVWNVVRGPRPARLIRCKFFTPDASERDTPVPKSKMRCSLNNLQGFFQ
ncbi:MAG: acyl-CoA desaturase [Pyrinomonadaceae bacterium]